MRIETPNRVARTHVQRLAHPVEAVFPLLCPVREAQWAVGWDPDLVLTRSGVVEDGCVFVTHTGVEHSVWVVTLHDPRAHLLEMVRVTPGVEVCRIAISLSDRSPVGTDCAITYEITSLGSAGDTRVAAFTEEHYRAFMATWEREIEGCIGAA